MDELTENKCQCPFNLTGTLSTNIMPEVYEGSYKVQSVPFVSQILETKDKQMADNIEVLEVPYYETRNPANGTTVYIGKGGN